MGAVCSYTNDENGTEVLADQNIPIPVKKPFVILFSIHRI